MYARIFHHHFDGVFGCQHCWDCLRLCGFPKHWGNRGTLQRRTTINAILRSSRFQVSSCFDVITCSSTVHFKSWNHVWSKGHENSMSYAWITISGGLCLPWFGTLFSRRPSVVGLTLSTTGPPSTTIWREAAKSRDRVVTDSRMRHKSHNVFSAHP